MAALLHFSENGPIRNRRKMETWRKIQYGLKKQNIWEKQLEGRIKNNEKKEKEGGKIEEADTVHIVT